MPFSQVRLHLPLHALIAETRQQRRINHPPQPRGHTGHFTHHGRGGFTPGPSRWPRNPHVSGGAAYPTQPIIPGYIRREKHFVGWSPGVEGSTTLASNLNHGVGDIEGYLVEIQAVFNFAPVHEMLPPITILSLKQPCPVSQWFLHHQCCGPAVHTLTGSDQWSYHHGDSSSCKPAKATGTLPAADFGGSTNVPDMAHALKDLRLSGNKRKREDDEPDCANPQKKLLMDPTPRVKVYWNDRIVGIAYLTCIENVHLMHTKDEFVMSIYNVLCNHQLNNNAHPVYYSQWDENGRVEISIDGEWEQFRQEVRAVVVHED